MAAASAFFLSHPVMGAGLGMDVLALNEVRGASWLHVHNIYLNYAVDLGTPGAVLFIALVAMSIRTATSAERSHDGLPPEWAILAAGVRISLWGFVVGGFFAPVAYNFYFYYLAGLAVSLRTIVWNAQHKGLVAAGQTKPCSI
jgi:O-antigen ligase